MHRQHARRAGCLRAHLGPAPAPPPAATPSISLSTSCKQQAAACGSPGVQRRLHAGRGHGGGWPSTPNHTSGCWCLVAAGRACTSEAAAAATGGVVFGRGEVACYAAAAGGPSATMTVAARTPEQHDSMYGMSQDDLLQLLWESAGLRALEFAPAVPHMEASPRFPQVTRQNFAAWVSLLCDLGVQQPTALLSTCPGFLLIELGEEEHSGATHSISSNLISGSAPGAREERLEHAGVAASSIHHDHDTWRGVVTDRRTGDSGAQLGEAPEAWESGWGGEGGAAGAGGPGFAASCCRFVLHLRDELFVQEGVVFGLVSRLPRVVHASPEEVEGAIAHLAVVIKSAGRGHRMGPKQLEAHGGNSSDPASSGTRTPTPSPSAGLASTSRPALMTSPAAAAAQEAEAESADLDAALCRFLLRAPAVLTCSRRDLNAALQALSAHGGVEFVPLCRLLCAVPEMLAEVVGMVQEAEGGRNGGQGGHVAGRVRDAVERAGRAVAAAEAGLLCG